MKNESQIIPKFDEHEEACLICPYCEGPANKPTEFAEHDLDDYFDEAYECSRCGKKFELLVSIKAVYSTKPRCKANDEFCDFPETPDYTVPMHGEFYHCKICGCPKAKYYDMELKANWERRAKPYEEGEIAK